MTGFGKQTMLQFTESIIGMNAEKVVQDISPRPLFVAHGKHNFLHPLEEALSLYKMAVEPKELYLIDGKHNDFMYADHPVFRNLLAALLRFFNHHLRVADVSEECDERII